MVGNTRVDSCEYISNTGTISIELENIVQKNHQYYLCTLHRRENINNFKEMWSQLNEISKNKTILYIKHPSVPDAKNYLSKSIIQLDPLSYQDMIYAIKFSDGIISDSGGLQEEAICLEKNILICRDTSERPETIESGYGLLVGKKIKENIKFLENKSKKTINNNPYGANVIDKVIDVLID